jgi:hypothetical protein
MSRRLWLGIFWLLGIPGALAQVRTPARETAFAPHLITLREGETIVNTARERERQTASRPDCSHLVYEVYTLAGYPYPYADSFDLYTGADGFVRVTQPQPGDLVVWRGHVGIVVNPAKHSFYSSVTSGLRTEFYDAPAWRARGSARFYRYASATHEDVTLVNARLPRITKDSEQVVTAPPVEHSRRTSLGTAQPMTRGADSISAEPPDLESPSSGPVSEIPSSILVAASREWPTQAEITGAVSELNNGTGRILRDEDLSHLGRKVVVYDSLSVAGTEFKGNRGSAQVRIKSRVTLLGDGIERKGDEESRWDLLRVESGWEVLGPKDRIYVPRDVAVRMLAARLASLARDAAVYGSDSSLLQQTQIVHALSALFQKDQ